MAPFFAIINIVGRFGLLFSISYFRKQETSASGAFLTALWAFALTRAINPMLISIVKYNIVFMLIVIYYSATGAGNLLTGRMFRP